MTFPRYSSQSAKSALLALSLSLGLMLCAIPQSARAGDWPIWRGPNQNRISGEKGLVDTWDPKQGVEGNVLWKNENLGSRSTPVIMDGQLFTIIRDQPGTELEGEKIVCVDANSGEIKWEHRFNVYLSDVPDTRVGWSSVSCDPTSDLIYAQGVCGNFVCLEADSGKIVWQRSLHEELGLLSTYGGRTNFPLIYKDTVITSAVIIGWGDTPKWGLLAKPAHRFIAMDKKTGEIRWLSGTRLIPYDTTYSTPTITKLKGQDALVFGSGDGAVWAMQAATGKPLWKYQLSRRGLNVSPAVSPDGRVFTGHSEENIVGTAMGAFVAIDGKQIGGEETNDLKGAELWIRNDMVGKSSPIFHKNRVYAVTDSAKLLIYNAEDGEQIGSKALGRVMRGSPLMADGKIYAATRGGVVHILRPTEQGVESLSKVRLRGEQIDASPIAANGKIYLPTSDAIYCIGDPKAEPAESRKPNKPAKQEINDKRVAQAQLVPWDVLLSPSKKQKYRVRLFNAAGQFLREAKPDKIRFGVAGPGAIKGDGTYTAPKEKKHQTVLVLAEVEGISARARVRIVPPLPWNFNFEEKDAKVPLTWVGGRIRYVPREGEDGSHYLAKPTELPTRPGAPTTKLGTRSRMWMGPHTLKNYTVEADIQLQEGGGSETNSSETSSDELSELPTANTAIKLPTAGLINSRYTFALFGPNQEARLYSWCTHDKRTQAAVKMELEAEVWYRMKLKVVPDKKKGIARVRAKIWPREDPEPDNWTLKFDDKAPNYEGSPGLFGDAKDAEFYVDNLRVTPN